MRQGEFRTSTEGIQAAHRDYNYPILGCECGSSLPTGGEQHRPWHSSILQDRTKLDNQSWPHAAARRRHICDN
jgi:hypothetical protein